MQPSWTSNTNFPAEVAAALIAQAASLLQRIVEVERALGAREWWRLGRAVPEAGHLAEIASLLAVARGELEQALAEQFDWRMLAPEWETPADEGDPAALSGDQAWAHAREEEASGLRRMLGKVLPGMQSFAEQLWLNAQAAGAPASALDALGIVSDRIGESIETLRQSPE